MKLNFTLVAAAVVASSCAPLQAEVYPVNGIKVIVHDAVITLQDVYEQGAKAQASLAQDYRNEPEILERKRAEVNRDSTEVLLERQLILHEFKVSNLTIPEKYIEDAVRDEMRRFGDRTTLIKSLEGKGTTYEKFKRSKREQLIEGIMRRHYVSPEKIIISPHKIEAYYEEHKETFKLQDRVKLRMITLNKPPGGGDPSEVRKTAEEVLAKLNVGAVFAELAKQYSQGAQRSEGGLFGWGDRTVLRKDLADAAFALKPGEHSGIIDAPDAFYLLQVEEVQVAHYTPLSEVREQIEKDLTDSERARLERLWIEKLKKKTFTCYLDS